MRLTTALSLWTTAILFGGCRCWSNGFQIPTATKAVSSYHRFHQSSFSPPSSSSSSSLVVSTTLHATPETNDTTNLPPPPPTINPSDIPPFPDQPTLHATLYGLSIQTHNLKSAAQRADNLLSLSERWYTDRIANGFHVLPTPNEVPPPVDVVDPVMVVIGPIPDTRAYSYVIDAYARVGNTVKTMELLRTMEGIENVGGGADDGSSSTLTTPAPRRFAVMANTNTYNAVLQSFGQMVQYNGVENEGVAIQVEELLEEMRCRWESGVNPSCEPNVSTYNTILNVYATLRAPTSGTSASKLLTQMWTIHNSSAPSDPTINRIRLTPDRVTYATAISAWARSGRGAEGAAKAEELLEIMEGKREEGFEGLGPDTYAVNAVLNAWAKSHEKGSALRAEKILTRMEDLYVNGGRTELRPNDISYNTVISAYIKSTDPDAPRRAEYFLRRMDRLSSDEATQLNFYSCKPDLISFNSVINAWVKSKDRDRTRRAEAILRHMERQNTIGALDVRPDVYTYTTVINAWAKSREKDAPQRAEAVLRRMEASYREGNESAKPNALCYNTVCNAWAKSTQEGAADRAVATFELMDGLYKEGEESVKPDVYTFTSVIDALGRRGSRESAERAVEMLRMMEGRYVETEDEDVKPNVRTYTSAINAISRSRTQPERAENILNHLEEIASKSDQRDAKIDVVCYNSVINAWGWSTEPGKAIRAFNVYKRMIDQAKAGAPDAIRPDCISLNSVLNACAFTNKRDETDRTAALNIAIKAFEFVTTSDPKYGSPNHISYSTMLMMLNNLLPPDDYREGLAKNLFWRCCKGGHLSGFVMSQLFKTLSDDAVLELFGEAAARGPGGRVVIDRNKVPVEWSATGDFEKGGDRGGRRKSQPSEKKKLTEVTKRQLNRNRRQ